MHFHKLKMHFRKLKMNLQNPFEKIPNTVSALYNVLPLYRKIRFKVLAKTPEFFSIQTYAKFISL